MRERGWQCPPEVVPQDQPGGRVARRQGRLLPHPGPPGSESWEGGPGRMGWGGGTCELDADISGPQSRRGDPGVRMTCPGGSDRTPPSTLPV